MKSPHALWRQAYAEHPDDDAGRVARYNELLREHGHIVKVEPGEDRNLPCGWPGTQTKEDQPDG